MVKLPKYKQIGSIWLSFSLLLALLQPFAASGQSEYASPAADSTNLFRNRKKTVVYTSAALLTTSLIVLNEAWYKNYPRSSFHFINDNSNWLQMDKIGHAATAYYVGKLGMSTFKWAGMSDAQSVFIGGSMGFLFLSTIEVLDGYSANWGASGGDVLANLSGASLLIGQELLWGEQRMELKFSYSPTKFAEKNPAILGSNPYEEILKDYNGQTYWLSINPWSFAKDSHLPKWLSFSIGYSGQSMLNPSDSNLPDNRYRRYFLSLDLKLSNIETGSKFWNAFLSALNLIKLPMPAIEYNSNKQLKFHSIYF